MQIYKQDTSVDKLNMDLMNIPCRHTLSHFATVAEYKAYKQGHRDARHAAVEVMLEHFKEESATLASQEDITGTTGASRAEALRQEVCTMYQYLDDREWAEHIAVTPEGQCLETAITRLVSEIADLRAQLAAKGNATHGQGDKPVARLQAEVSDRPYSEGETLYEVVILDRARCEDGMELFVAPASAQPADAPSSAAGKEGGSK